MSIHARGQARLLSIRTRIGKHSVRKFGVAAGALFGESRMKFDSTLMLEIWRRDEQDIYRSA